MPTSGSDLGHAAPPGTELVLSDVWWDGNVQVRAGGSFTSVSTTPATFQAIAGTGPAPSVAVGAGAGTGASVASRVGHDLGGSFVLNAGTTPAGGVLATVTFGTTLAAAPVSVVVTAGNTTGAATTDISVGAISLTTTGFTIQGSAPAASPATYLISYQVVAS